MSRASSTKTAQHRVDLEHAFQMGYECGYSGPNETNCDFRIFSSPEFTKEWERGKLHGETAKRTS